jgi:hypothetical protein
MAITPHGCESECEGDVNPHRSRMINKTAGNSVQGIALKLSTATPYGLLTCSRGGGDIIARCVAIMDEVGVADGSYATVQLAEKGRNLTVYFSEAVTAGEYAVADNGNAGQFTGEAGITANQTLGVIQQTIGGAGVAKVTVDAQ